MKNNLQFDFICATIHLYKQNDDEVGKCRKTGLQRSVSMAESTLPVAGCLSLRSAASERYSSLPGEAPLIAKQVSHYCGIWVVPRNISVPIYIIGADFYLAEASVKYK